MASPRNPRDPYNRRSDYRSQSRRSEREAALGSGVRQASTSEKIPAEMKIMTDRRVRIMIGLVVIVGLILAGRLAWIQVVWGPDLAAKAVEQRARIYTEPARRGSISDRNGNPMAYTMQARSLTVSPVVLRKELREQAQQELGSSGEDVGLSDDKLTEKLDQRVQDTLKEMSEDIPKMIEDAGASNHDVKPSQILDKLKEDSHYEVLVRNVDPDVATEVSQKWHGVAADHQDIREYPNGAVGENIIGKVSMDGQGQFGFEASGDATLSGIDGKMTEDVSRDGMAIPGTLRDQTPAVDGTDVSLTLDLDLQTYVQQQLEQAKANSGAKNAEAVVLDAKTAEVLAMANTDTIDPTQDIEKQLAEGKDFENPSISAPFEPGSVAKVVTAAATIDQGLTTPDEPLEVPGSINMAGVTVKDAWAHGTENYTTTGVFGKSSNVGTLMLAERLGEDKYADYLEKFGIGQSTGIELPNESQGLLPAREQWSGGTFANLPIGQGMSWTTLQMASVYQTLANGGERIEPRIIRTTADEDSSGTDAPKKTRVVSPETARTVVDMFRAVAQSDPTGIQQGTGPAAAVDGYQIAGKTGTAQKVDEDTGAYSMSKFWITFAGVAPADDPQYVVAIMLDEPERGTQANGAGGQSAAPVFHDIASWLLDRNNVPLSPPMEGQLVLQRD